MITREILINTTADTDIVDLTSHVADLVESSGLDFGEAILFVPGSTASLTTIEYEEGVLTDLRRAVERMAPQDISYLHDRRWGDGNGYSHVRAALLGPSLLVPFHNTRLLLGTWQQIVLLDFDNRPRHRRVLVRIRGE